VTAKGYALRSPICVLTAKVDSQHRLYIAGPCIVQIDWVAVAVTIIGKTEGLIAVTGAYRQIFRL